MLKLNVVNAKCLNKLGYAELDIRYYYASLGQDNVNELFIRVLYLYSISFKEVHHRFLGHTCIFLYTVTSISDYNFFLPLHLIYL